MSQENVELVRRAALAFADGDMEEAARILDPEVELHPPAEDPDVEPVYRGPDGFGTWLQTWLEAWEEFEFRIEEVLDAGDRVVVIYSQRGRGKASGVEIENRLGAVATVRDGRIVRGDLYLDPDEARRVAGLPTGS